MDGCAARPCALCGYGGGAFTQIWQPLVATLGLDSDVRIVSVEDAQPGFHARFDAISKTYEYRIATGPLVSAFEHRYVWHVPGTLDVEAMRVGAQSLLGRHDFAAFQSTGGEVHTTERTILSISVGSDRGQIGVRPGSDQGLTPLVIRVTGDGFLRHMVRTIAGTLVDVGLGRWPASHIAGIVEGRDRSRAGRAAPASGLFLVGVDYGDQGSGIGNTSDHHSRTPA